MLKKLNRLWRLIGTVIGYSFFGLGGVTLPWLAWPFIVLWPGTQTQKQRRARCVIQYIFKFFIHLMRTFRLLHWNIQDLQRLQRPGILIQANHPTLIDVVFLIAFTPNANCIIKSALLYNPCMRGFLRLAGFIPNDSQTVILQAEASLNSGSALIIFPEGTRTGLNGKLTFQRGAANIAIRTQTNITPVTIKCIPATLSKQHKWYYIPPEKVLISIHVHADIPIEPYTSVVATLAARRLTRDLEAFFTQALIQHTTTSTLKMSR